MIPIIPISNFKPVNTHSPILGDATLSGLKNPPPLSLYIHIPWCVKKCPYCDFNSHENRNKKDEEQLPEKRYVAALIADLGSTAAKSKACFLVVGRLAYLAQMLLTKF